MVKVKKNLKKKAEAEDAPEAPAKNPKMSPKHSPKSAPAAKPKKEDKKEANKANKEKEPKGDAARVSDEEKARLTKEAVELILKGIAKPDVQAKGAFVLLDWNAKFKDALGGYKKFCSGQTGVLHVAEVEGNNFRVLKHGEKLPQAAAKGTGDWKSQLLSAWSAYCKATPAHERSLDIFLAPTGDGGKKNKAETDDAPEEAPKKKKKVNKA